MDHDPKHCRNESQVENLTKNKKLSDGYRATVGTQEDQNWAKNAIYLPICKILSVVNGVSHAAPHVTLDRPEF